MNLLFYEYQLFYLLMSVLYVYNLLELIYSCILLNFMDTHVRSDNIQENVMIIQSFYIHLHKQAPTKHLSPINYCRTDNRCKTIYHLQVNMGLLVIQL